MRSIVKLSFLFLTTLIFFVPFPALALDNEQQKEFNRILKLRMADLTEEAAEVLEKKYPDEDWGAYDFPEFVYTNDSVEIGYMIAVKEPDLLGNPEVAVKDNAIPCYCFCDAMGHKSLLYCFWKDGLAGGEFDDHAADCNICYGQAMLAFLWAETGASEAEILKGMEKKFERLIKQEESSSN